MKGIFAVHPRHPSESDLVGVLVHHDVVENDALVHGPDVDANGIDGWDLIGIPQVRLVTSSNIPHKDSWEMVVPVNNWDFSLSFV